MVSIDYLKTILSKDSINGKRIHIYNLISSVLESTINSWEPIVATRPFEIVYGKSFTAAPFSSEPIQNYYHIQWNFRVLLATIVVHWIQHLNIAIHVIQVYKFSLPPITRVSMCIYFISTCFLIPLSLV